MSSSYVIMINFDLNNLKTWVIIIFSSTLNELIIKYKASKFDVDNEWEANMITM